MYRLCPRRRPWCVEKVTNALLRAFSRPGISKQYFEKIRNDIRMITVDGGSEFKRAFPATMKSIFPNSKVNVFPPKSQTYGRPTYTGPIEAAIRMLRKLFRDYGLGRSANIIEKKNKNVFRKTHALSYQNQKRQVQKRMWPYGRKQTHTPTQVMTSTSTPHVNI